MKIKKSQLRQIVREETRQVLIRENMLKALGDAINLAFPGKDAREARNTRKQILSTWGEEELEKWANEEWPKVQDQIQGMSVPNQRKTILAAMEEFTIEHTNAGFDDRQVRRGDEKAAAAQLDKNYADTIRTDMQSSPGRKKEYDRAIRKAKRRIELGVGTEEDERLVRLAPTGLAEAKLKKIIDEVIESMIDEKII